MRVHSSEEVPSIVDRDNALGQWGRGNDLTYFKYFYCVLEKKVTKSHDKDDMEGFHGRMTCSAFARTPTRREGMKVPEPSAGIYINLKGKCLAESGKGQGTALRRLFFSWSG